jgi:predicted dehydrogenase
VAKSKGKLKVAMIGTGGIARAVHLPAWRDCERAEVVACFDINRETAEKAAEDFGIPKVYGSLKKMLADADIDAVDICTPNVNHKPSALAAFKAGKHVYCEKPIAMNSREGAAMVAAAKAARKKLMIGLHNRYRGDTQCIKTLADAGRLGDIYYSRSLSIRRRGVPSWGVFGQKKLQGGGPLIDIGVHCIDLAWYLMGKPKPVSVSGKFYETIGKTPGHMGMFGPWDWKTYDVEDFAVALVRFEGDKTMMIESAFCVNLPEDKFTAEIVGDKGGATVSPLKVSLEEEGYLMNCEPQFVKDRVPPHAAGLWAFADAVLDGKPAPIPGEEALVTQKIIDALYKSSQLGREVKIS